MKKGITNQDRMIEEIMNDTKNVPSFIDGKKHLHIYRIMQSMFYALMKLAKPVFLTDYQIELINDELLDCEVQLALLADESLHSMVVVYVNKKLMGYYDLAIEYELFEITGNIKRFFEII